MRKPLLLALAFCIGFRLFAQFDRDYTPLTSSGPLPKDFVTLSSQKFEEAKKDLQKNEKGATRKTKEKFLLQSNFNLDDLLLSGKVLFNDRMGEYVNQVAKNVLVSEPEVYKQMRFYVLKSTVVNAFATNQGIVLVTTGMLAQLENEAELAFVLAHETVHFKEKHAINQYLETDKITQGKGVYEQLSFEAKLIAKCAYSKEQEKEADEKGLQIFLKSKYSTANLMGIYDVLKYAYLPFDDVEFDKDFFENKYFKFPQDYYKTNTQKIDTRDIDDDDRRSTHPSIAFRRAKTEEGIKGADNAEKSDYQVGKTDFEQVREIARFELCRLYTLYRRYEMGIYTSYLLLKKYPNNLYLKKNVAYCLAGLAQYSNADKFMKVHFDSDSVEGKSQALNYLIFRLDSVKGDLNIAALAYATKLKAEYPNDPEITAVYKNLMHSLVKVQKMDYSWFSKVPYTPPSPNDTVAKPKEPSPPKDNSAKSKYEKLREQEENAVKPGFMDTKYSKYAFVEYMDKDWFKNDFKEALEDNKEDEGVDEETESTGNKAYYDKTTYALGIDKVVAVDPIFVRVNARKKEKYKYLESEGGQLAFMQRLQQIAKKAKLDIELLNTKNLAENETQKLNQAALMSEFISERLSHAHGVNLPFVEQHRIDEVAKSHGTDYFMWTGALSLTDHNRMHPLLAAYCAIFPPVLLFAMPSLINGGQYTVYFTLVYDVKTGAAKMVSYREINNRTNDYILNSNIYDVMNQIKTPKKHKK